MDVWACDFNHSQSKEMSARSISLVVFLSVLAVNCSNREANPPRQIFSHQSQQGTGVYKPDSAVIAQHYKIPDWFRDAKFGVFIHWGVYSVPAFGSEWYPRNMYIKGSEEYEHHIEKYGPHSEFGYKDFIPMLSPLRKVEAAHFS